MPPDLPKTQDHLWERMTVKRSDSLWAIVLAAGDGVRMRDVVTTAYGANIPKQYCTFNGNTPLVRMALSRAGMVTTHQRTVVVVAAEHSRWWQLQLADLPDENLVVQPCNRGTACGVLLPLIRVLLEDPHAFVVVLPSDHFVTDEEVYVRAVRKAFRAARRADDSLVLLGISPDGLDSDLGWIEPTLKTHNGVHWVLSFIEKPVPEVAEDLRDRGFLWNSFVFVARGLALLEAYSRAFPGLVERFGSVWADRNSDDLSEQLTSLYANLPSLDLSRDLLQSKNMNLRVLPVPPCGWTDLGTPERVARCLERFGSRAATPVSRRSRPESLPDLATAVSSSGERPTAGSSPRG